MGFVTTEKGEAAMEESANSKAKEVREALLELQLPLEVIEQAVKKIPEYGGNIDAIATYALNLSIPQVDFIEEHLSDDMISSDEDAGPEPEEKWMQPPSKVQSPTVAPKEEVWEDPICKLFQEPHAENHTMTRHESGSSTAAGGSVQAMVNQVVTVEAEAEAGCSYRFSMEKSLKREVEPTAPPEPTTPLGPPASPAPLAPPQSSEQRETSFLEMGFAFDLVQRAFKHHGAEADDSVLVQFLIDNQGNNPRIAQHVNEEESDSEEELRARVRQNVAVRSLKAPAISPRQPEFTKDSDSDSDNEPELAPCNDWGAETSDFVKPASICSRGIPENGGHRAAMQSLGFSPALIERAVQELGEGVEYDMLLEYLLYLSTEQNPEASTAVTSSRNGEISTLTKLTTEFQFPSVAVEKAMDRCKTPWWNATQEEIADLVDFLAAHMETLIEEDAYGSITLPDSDDSDESDEEGEDVDDGLSYWNWEDGKGKGTSSMSGKRKFEDRIMEKGKKPAQRGRPKGVFNGVRRLTATVSKPTLESKYRGAVGFGLPGQTPAKRHLKEDVKGAPFFYFENVAGMPAGEWERIQMHLFDIKAEFVDAMHFSACRRSRGYIHNLPIEGRKKIIKDPPMTIMELMPQTKPFWPEWDKRTKLNCINTVRASEFLSKRLGITDGTAFQKEELSPEERKNFLYWCCKLNLVWTSPNIPSPIEANEIEAMLGFDRDHSRHCFGLTARYKALGNSFSVFTVAYHFSTLKPLYPKGIKVLSLFSGIGGAEVALHKVGIKLNVVVSVELEEGARRCLQTWWAVTKQEGHLDVDYHDVRHLTRETVTKLVDKYRGFDLIVGGSPCNNLTGNNRHTRTGLEGEHSTMFFEFSRIVSTVRELTIKLQGR